LLPKNDWSENSYWLYTVILNGYGESARDQLVAKLCCRGVDARPGFYPMHQMEPYADFGKSDYPVSTFLATNSIGLPSSPGLVANEIQHIAGVFLSELESLTKFSE
jgi:dTDP-4-amino-4,6-dideoxygalactose transaminase